MLQKGGLYFVKFLPVFTSMYSLECLSLGCAFFTTFFITSTCFKVRSKSVNFKSSSNSVFGSSSNWVPATFKTPKRGTLLAPNSVLGLCFSMSVVFSNGYLIICFLINSAAFFCPLSLAKSYAFFFSLFFKFTSAPLSIKIWIISM